jgi:hypothetical protein
VFVALPLAPCPGGSSRGLRRRVAPMLSALPGV